MTASATLANRAPEATRFGWFDLASLLVSAVAAYFFPLATFLGAYIFLGPLHYFTEIAWLRKKDFYFGEGMIKPRTYLLLAALFAVVTILDFRFHHRLGYAAIFPLLVLSLSVWIRNRFVLAMLAAACILAPFVSNVSLIVIAMLVPTLIHVFVFTGMFMVSGALRARPQGLRHWINPTLLVLIPIALLFVHHTYAPQAPFWVTGEQQSFSALHQRMAIMVHHPWNIGPDLLREPVAAAIMRVFGFTYLFHYLNWFGKTRLLEWHRVSRNSWIAIAVLYMASIALYLWKVHVGFMIVNFAGAMHVLLEFPLDWHAIRFVSQRALGRSPAVRPTVAASPAARPA